MKAIIYKIINIKTEDFYIGSSAQYKRRKGKHLYDLRKNKHPCVHLQNSYNKHGLINFEFHILEEFEYASKDEILNKEQYYLDTLKPIYNICSKAGSPLGVKRSEEFKKKVSDRVGVQRKKAISLFSKGYDSKQVKKELNICWSSVCDAKTEYCKQEGIQKRKTGIKVIDITTNIIYDRIIDAAKELNISFSSIQRDLKRIIKKTNLRIWEPD